MATASNLDSTGLRLVRKGVAVTYGPNAGVVVRLLNGNCMVQWEDSQFARVASCNLLTVGLPRPHLKRARGWWFCRGGGFNARHKSPKLAYEAWKRQYITRTTAQAKRVQVIRKSVQ